MNHNEWITDMEDCFRTYHFNDRYFKSKVRHVRNLPVDQPQNAELFYTIEILDEAIERNHQVVFHYGDYGTDKHLHLR